MSSVPASLIYRIDDLEVDPSRGCVRRRGREIHLRPKTFEILLYLVAHRDRLISREELLERFWNGTVVSDDVLAHSIAELRRIFGDKSRDSQYLKTVPKRGYRFVGPVQQVSPEFAIATEETTIVEVREEYSDDDSPHRDLPVSAEHRALPPPQGGRRKRLALLVSAAVLCAATALTSWTYWRRPVATHEPQWWEAAWWKLDEGVGSTITDSVHGLTGELPDRGVVWAPGISGSALLSTGQYTVRGIDSQGLLPAGLTPRTLMAWIKASTLVGDPVLILAQGDMSRDADAGSIFGLVLNETGAGGFGTGHFVLAGEDRLDDGRWHQIAGVFEGATSKVMRLFVDAAEKAKTQVQFPLVPAKVSQWAIGNSFDGLAVRMAVDDARVYERALRSDEIRSLYRCMAGGDDIETEGGGSYYFASLWGDHLQVFPRQSGSISASVKNLSNDFGGLMFVRREPGCGLRSIHGSDMGQDLNIELELRVPAGPNGLVTEGGPYFRSRRANPGDGILGGTSAGYWARLDSTGQVRVQSVYPITTLALSRAPKGFNSDQFHKLEVAVRANSLEVALDGQIVSFDAGGVQRTILEMRPVWETVSPRGSNGGSAGIAFGCPRNRGQAGGQEARNIRVKPYHPLSQPDS